MDAPSRVLSQGSIALPWLSPRIHARPLGQIRKDRLAATSAFFEIGYLEIVYLWEEM